VKRFALVLTLLKNVLISWKTSDNFPSRYEMRLILVPHARSSLRVFEPLRENNGRVINSPLVSSRHPRKLVEACCGKSSCRWHVSVKSTKAENLEQNSPSARTNYKNEVGGTQARVVIMIYVIWRENSRVQYSVALYQNVDAFLHRTDFMFNNMRFPAF